VDAKHSAPHFQQVTQAHIETAANLHSKPVEEHGKPTDEKHKGKRASDKDIA
jgi:hypothetical protein